MAVKNLIDRGADINVINEELEGKTLLHIAAELGSTPEINIIILILKLLDLIEKTIAIFSIRIGRNH